MSEVMPKAPREEPARPHDTDRCELCGAFTEQRIADRTICQCCYEGRSSCCTEFMDEG